MGNKAKCRWDPHSSPSVANCKGCPDLVWEEVDFGPEIATKRRRMCKHSGRIPGNMKTCPKEQP